ncbi:MAG: hypothetical protein N2235_10485 [Fischerella sp.]|nr:hypothetical protein [Fischerella sp.]
MPKPLTRRDILRLVIRIHTAIQQRRAYFLTRAERQDAHSAGTTNLLWGGRLARPIFTLFMSIYLIKGS